MISSIAGGSRRWHAGLAAALGVMLLAVGCGSTPSASAGTSSAPSLLAQILKSGQLTYAVAPYPPDEYQTNQGVWTGRFIDLMTAMAAYYHVKPVPVATTFQAMVADMQAHKVDFGTDLNYSAARAKVIDYVNPLENGGEAILVNPQASGLTTWQQATAAGKNICVDLGGLYDQLLTAIKPAATIQRYPTFADCELAVFAGRSDGAFLDWYSAAQLASAHPGYKLLFPPDPPPGGLASGNIGIAIDKGWQPKDLTSFNNFITYFVNSGQWAAIDKKYAIINPSDYAEGTIPAWAQKLLS